MQVKLHGIWVGQGICGTRKKEMEYKDALVRRQTGFDGYVGRVRSQWPSAFHEFTLCLSTRVESAKGQTVPLAMCSTVGTFSKDFFFHFVAEVKKW